jgi:hypothetical protein
MIFNNKGLVESKIKIIYDKIRESSYSHQLILLKEALVFIDKEDEAQKMMESAKKLFTFIKPQFLIQQNKKR